MLDVCSFSALGLGLLGFRENSFGSAIHSFRNCTTKLEDYICFKSISEAPISAYNLFSFPSLHLLQKTLARCKVIRPVDCPQQNLKHNRKQIGFRAATFFQSNTFVLS